MPEKINKTASRTVLSQVWTEIFHQIVYFWGKKDFLSSIFYFSILSHGGAIKINKTASRTVHSHLWTDIFPKIVYFGKKKDFFFCPQILISLFYHKQTQYILTGPLITLFYLICGPRYLKMHIFSSSNLAQKYHKISTKIAFFFYFSILSHGGPQDR